MTEKVQNDQIVNIETDLRGAKNCSTLCSSFTACGTYDIAWLL